MEKYTHLAVNKYTNLIVNGWDYSDVDPSDLKQFKNDYFTIDIKENGFNPKAYKIITSQFAKKNGVSQWSNTGVFPVEEESKMKQEGIDFYKKAYDEHPDWFYDNIDENKTYNDKHVMKKRIKLTESQLQRVIQDATYRILKEEYNLDEGFMDAIKAGYNAAKGQAKQFGNQVKSKYYDARANMEGDKIEKNVQTANAMKKQLDQTYQAQIQKIEQRYGVEYDANNGQFVGNTSKMNQYRDKAQQAYNKGQNLSQTGNYPNRQQN